MMKAIYNCISECFAAAIQTAHDHMNATVI